MRFLIDFVTDQMTWAILAGMFTGHVISNEVRPVGTPEALVVAVVCYVAAIAFGVRRELRDV